MTTTISKVILFKKFIMSKKCQELASGLLWVNSERKDGGREEGDSVLGKPLLLNHFLYPPPTTLCLPSCPSPLHLHALVVFALVYQTVSFLL